MEYFLIIIFLIMLGFILFMVKEAFANRIIQLEVLFPDFPDTFGEMKVFFISDVHRREIPDKMIEKIQGMQPNMVIIGGDLVEKGVPIEKAKKNLQKLRKLGPAYFVWGNNDYEVDNQSLKKTLLECDVKVLNNSAEIVTSEKDERLILMGVDEVSFKRDRLDLALQNAGEDGFKILVCHNPQIMNKIKKEHDIRFVLSGHTHGGQIHIFGYSPYEKGSLKVLKETTILISNGYGTTALPLRLGAKSETHLITLKKR